MNEPPCWVCALPMTRKAGTDWLCGPCQVMVTFLRRPPAELRPSRLEFMMDGTWTVELYVDHGVTHRPVP